MSEVPPPFDELWFQLLSGYIVGLCLGSFITMLSYRLPRKLSLLHPSSSFCPNCKTLLKPRDLVPFFSWAVAGGKCHYCHEPISLRYPLIELATGTLCAIAFGTISFQPALIIVLLLIVICVTWATVKLEGKA